MPTSTSERNHILHLVESGSVTAQEAAQLLDALEVEQKRPDERPRSRTVRIRVTNVPANRQKVNMTATMPVKLIQVSLHLVAQLVPRLNSSTIEDVLRAIEEGATGRLLDIQDLEEGKRVEIFAE